MPFPKEPIHTIADIYALPDGQRAELINGQLFDMASPNRIHQKLVSKLSTIFWNYIEVNHGSCEVYPTPFAVFLNKDDKTYVEPDISIIYEKDKLSDRGCEGAPDFVIEIVSPATQKRDYGIKLCDMLPPLKSPILKWGLPVQ